MTDGKVPCHLSECGYFEIERWYFSNGVDKKEYCLGDAWWGFGLISLESELNAVY